MTAEEFSSLSSLLELDENLISYPRGIRHDLSQLAVDQEPSKSIIKSIQLKGSWHPPATIDLSKFALEIKMLRENYREWERLDSDAEAKRRHKRLCKLHHHLKTAVSLYAADGPWLDRELTWMWRGDFNFIRALENNAIQSPSKGLHELNDAMSLLAGRVKALIDDEAQAGHDQESAHPLRHFTPTRLLALELERIGCEYLALEPKFSRDANGQLAGPFMRFSRATIKTIGASLTSETIAKAIQDNRRQQARKRRATATSS